VTAASDAYPWLEDLLRPDAYPPEAGAEGGVRRINTHISHVFLTDARVFKLRRPVRLSFVDFSSAEERLADCLREVRLNRRLAPDLYLGIAPVLRDGDRVRVGPLSEEPAGEALEHGVVMRRLAEGRDLRSMLERGEASARHVDRIAARMSAFHADHSLGAPAPVASEEWLARTTGPARANFDAVAEAPASLVPPSSVEEIRRLAAAFVESHRDDFERRRANGRVVDGHGDLHTEHVWFETDASEPIMVDCLEFRDDFRRIDAASDVAFLAMDLAYRGRRDLGDRFLRRYARDSGDYHLFAVVDYFLSYRALVRAKVASLVATDAALPASQREGAAGSVRRHLDLGLGFLAGTRRGGIVLTCGTIGTGKTTVAEEIADRTGGVVISSDRLRRAAGTVSEPAAGSTEGSADGEDAMRTHDAPAGAGYGRSRYNDDARAAVYGRMLAEARHVVSSGRVAVLDATYSRRAWRQAALEWSRANDCDAFLVEVVAPRDDVLERLAARQRAGNDASEAGPGLYDAMRAEFEPADEWPVGRRTRIDTSRPDWPDAVAKIGDGSDFSIR
jgi:aminoglycoside phosphotransferase family enzyme/predicted kinase